MNMSLLLPLVAFAFVTSITPGPNNMMLLASGANFGFRRTIPHMLGVALGFGLMALLMGLGLAQIFTRVPQAELALKLLSCLYMLWLAWKIARAAPPATAPEQEPEQISSEAQAAVQNSARPFTFLMAAGFQWVNPKAWAMALTAVSVYAAPAGLTGLLWVVVVLVAVNLPSIALWAWGGQQIRRWMTTPRRLRIFNWSMAVLLVLSLWAVLE